MLSKNIWKKQLFPYWKSYLYIELTEAIHETLTTFTEMKNYIIY